MKKTSQKQKKLKEIKFPMKFNLMTAKYEPDLPSRKGPLVVEIKRNWWAFWYIIIEFLLALFSIGLGIYLLFKK